jgi:hypothetical protein
VDEIKLTKEQAEALIQIKIGGIDLFKDFYMMAHDVDQEDSDYVGIGDDEAELNNCLENIVDGYYYDIELWRKEK